MCVCVCVWGGGETYVSLTGNPMLRPKIENIPHQWPVVYIQINFCVKLLCHLFKFHFKLFPSFQIKINLIILPSCHRRLLILSDLDTQNEANLGSHPSPAWVPSNMATGPSPSCSEISGRDLSIVPTFSFTFVEKYIHKRNISSGSSHINKGVKYFSEGYLHQIRGK